MRSKKQHIRLWFEYLQICHSDPQYSENLKQSKDFYEEWDDVLNIKFDDWWVFNHGRPITKKKFTQMLGDFGIKPTKRSNANVFYVADLEDAFERYLTHT